MPNFRKKSSFSPYVFSNRSGRSRSRSVREYESPPRPGGDLLLFLKNGIHHSKTAQVEILDLSDLPVPVVTVRAVISPPSAPFGHVSPNYDFPAIYFVPVHLF